MYKVLHSDFKFRHRKPQPTTAHLELYIWNQPTTAHLELYIWNFSKSEDSALLKCSERIFLKICFIFSLEFETSVPDFRQVAHQSSCIQEEILGQEAAMKFGVSCA